MARSLAAILLGLLVVASLGTAKQAELDDVLWFTYSESPPSRNNFTTYPPTGSDASGTVETKTFLNRSEARWTSWVPTDWTIHPDKRMSLEIHIEGLGRVVPVADPRTEPDANGKIRVRGTLWWRESGVPIATGSIDMAPRPTTETRIDRVAFDLVAVEERTLPAREGALGLIITVNGYTRQELPLNIYFGSREHPSHLRSEGFPVAAFRAHEDAERAHKECLERVLQKMECESVGSPTEESHSKQSPIASTGFMATMILLMIYWVRHRPRRPGEGQGLG